MRSIVPAILMVLALIWLTVSLPFVYQSQVYSTEISTATDTPPEEDTPLSTSEEKCISGSAQEEYLHHHDQNLVLSSLFLTHTSGNMRSIYVAFHGELLSPPPEFIA